MLSLKLTILKEKGGGKKKSNRLRNFRAPRGGKKKEGGREKGGRLGAFTRITSLSPYLKEKGKEGERGGRREGRHTTKD